MLTEGKRPANTPSASLLGGQPGAGKTTLHDIVDQREPNTILVNADDFRAKHPHFKALNKKYVSIQSPS